MKTIKLRLQNGIGPIFSKINKETQKVNTGISLIDKNETIQALNYKIHKIYIDSIFKNNNNDFLDSFNNSVLIESLIQELIDNINKVNDGSFIVEDLINNK